MTRDRTPAPRAGNVEIDAFLKKVAETPAPQGRSGRGRLIFAMDATASRQPSWDRACHVQAEMFAATAALGGLDVQLVWYRGHGECKVTPFASDPQALSRRMQGVACLGGLTQIGRVLNHAIKETERRPVDALVFVGDAAEEDVDRLSDYAGRLGLLRVPVFVFHEGGDPGARYAFQQIAKLSGGAYCAFDSSSADQLKQLLGAVAAYAAGGRRALEDYGRRQGGAALRLLADLR